jgi:hypothetical protein
MEAFRVRDVERGALPTPGDGNVGIAVCADGVTTKSGGQDDRRDQWERPRGKASKDRAGTSNIMVRLSIIADGDSCLLALHDSLI